jgi:nicotinamidase-related amidase
VTVDPLLIVVDMQEIFRDPESPWVMPSFDAVVEPVARLADAFGERTAFTRFVPPPPGERPGSWRPYYETFGEVLREDRPGWFEIVETLRERAMRTIERPTFTAWGGRMRALAGEPATLVLCGVATDCCVISTALDAIEDGAFVRVVEDACGGSSDASHDAAIRVLRGYAPQVEISSLERELEVLAPATP